MDNTLNRLLILGAGQYGCVSKEVAGAMGCFSQIDFLDDHSDIAIGKLDDLDKTEYDTAFIAIGNPTMRSGLLGKVKKLATLIHPNAVVSPSAVIGEGCIIEAGAVISTDVKIERGTIVMANAVVGHNATVGKCCQLKYNCAITENATVTDMTKVDCNEVFH